ncbi:MAG: rod shape-determining protein MreD [Clostridia bacterium]|nr:rod shape-determining protein MreD [Clostridia bacterium]
MKKFLIGVVTYIIFIILYFVQADFFSWFTIAGISPNIFIIFILFLGLFTDNMFSIIMALLTGITLDLIIGKTVGITAIMFCLIAIIAGYFDKNFSKESKLTIMIMVIRNDNYL